MRHILFIAFLLQSLIPVGFMPAFANDQRAIVICSGVTGEVMTIHLNGESSGHNDKTQSDCSYSVVGGYITPDQLQTALINTHTILTQVKVDHKVVLQSFFLSNHTRGPPLLSLA